MAGNFFLSILFATALQYLWGMVNALQIIVLAGLFKIKIPENLRIILIEVTKACNFDLISTEKLYKKYFGFRDTPSFSLNFEEADYEGSIFIVGLGTLFLFIVGFPFYALTRSIAKWIFRK